MMLRKRIAASVRLLVGLPVSNDVKPRDTAFWQISPGKSLAFSELAP
jgi:hypothetical protein